MIYLSPQ